MSDRKPCVVKRLRLFGPFSRYALDRVTTDVLGESVTMFCVTDAEGEPDETGLPPIIRQARTEAEAVAGLPTDAEA